MEATEVIDLTAITAQGLCWSAEDAQAEETTARAYLLAEPVITWPLVGDLRRRPAPPRTA